VTNRPVPLPEGCEPARLMSSSFLPAWPRRSAIDHPLRAFGVTVPVHRYPSGGAVDLAQIIGRELDGPPRRGFVQAVQLLVPGIGRSNGFCASTQASAICRRRRLLSSLRSYPPIHQALVRLAVLRLKRGTVLRQIGAVDLVVSSICP